MGSKMSENKNKRYEIHVCPIKNEVVIVDTETWESILSIPSYPIALNDGARRIANAICEMMNKGGLR